MGWSCHIALLTVTLWCIWSGVDAGDPRSLPCPDAQDIYPCYCYIREDYEMDMFCSRVTSSEQLAQIFSVDFPFWDFESLVISYNDDLTTIRHGDLGQATFRKISIYNSALESVVFGAFENSYNTLIDLKITGTSLSLFPFVEIEYFTSLVFLDVSNNTLHSFPTLTSASLRALYMDFNPIGSISATSLTNLPSLTTVSLLYTGLTYIPPGTFVGLPQLQEVHLDLNDITMVYAGTVEMIPSNSQVHLNANAITRVEVGALNGVTGEVWIQDNNLDELAEDVWRPLMDDGVNLYAARNPLSCGCEIAWIVLNTKYMNALKDAAMCEDGELVIDLDPGIFIAMCP